ncbi:hypothetical protein [Streptomyces sp. JJ36]|uniref:hypothetical protein n=1 Tax=Streptomyces sp. JJ36 TaxID=2736645 RepID=UPI001F1AFE7B|nr:hypothetical protein [Streptomyces sp. JJ36]MCF6524836.1 hypothetical protein [Streptomyces sp. JJ36]
MAKEQLSSGGQLIVLAWSAVVFLCVGAWLLVSERKWGAKVINDWRAQSGASPRGERETRILMRVIGTVFIIGGLGITAGAVAVALR